MNMRYKTAVLITLVAASLSLLAYAIVWQVTMLGQVNVVSAGNLAVYWDAACTQRVDVIDFGDHVQGANASKTLYIRNEATVTRVLDWSGLGSTANVTDSWDYQTGQNGGWENIEGYSLGAGQVLETRYQVSIYSNAALGSVTWTLRLGYR